jgi:ubiquinone/menaquinone biosynthesis C-methylase UbiE
MGDQSVLKQAFTEMAPRYEQLVDNELQRFWGWSYEGFIDRLIEQMPIKENDLILDVATGTSEIPLKIAKCSETKFRIIGLDITPAMLFKGKKKIEASHSALIIHQVCASAMLMPWIEKTFDGIVCGLATHHMDVALLLSEMGRVIKKEGYIVLADVGGSPLWRFPGLRGVLKAMAFFYFLSTENLARAWAEAGAVSNVLSPDEWLRLLDQNGFCNINIVELASKHKWVPSPLIIYANRGGMD